jgi:hypothetical protein
MDTQSIIDLIVDKSKKYGFTRIGVIYEDKTAEYLIVVGYREANAGISISDKELIISTYPNIVVNLALEKLHRMIVGELMRE